MEDWLPQFKEGSSSDYYEAGLDQQDFLSNNHHWYETSHARPTYCNICREVLSGVTSHGYSCEICKCKVHKRCVDKAIANCKWTTLATVGRDIIEEKDGTIVMPHQWVEGNLPVSSTCTICKKTCGSVLRLQDWRCLWCKATVHTACRPHMLVTCFLGPAKVSVVPPITIHSVGIDEAWEVLKPQGNFSPLLVFVNSKSGDNQGIKFLRRFKQLLNPAQVFDLISTGPSLGLRLFRHFDLFRILVCSGDGSVGWVLSEIDRFDMHKQCRVAVLPLGTGNDLARVLGWGSSCHDDAHLPQILERYETASTKMLDRWSIMVFEKAIALNTPRMSLSNAQEVLVTGYVEEANNQLQSIVEADGAEILIRSVKILFKTVNELLQKICESHINDQQFNIKCDILRQKLGVLINTLKEDISEEQCETLLTILNDIKFKESSNTGINYSENNLSNLNISIEKEDKEKLNTRERHSRGSIKPLEKEDLQCRANSVKKAIYNVVEHSEPGRPKRYRRRFSVTPFEAIKVTTISSQDTSPCTSPPLIPAINVTYSSSLNASLTCISPFPDIKRNSVDENFLNAVNIPAPSQFADGSSRRSSGTPEVIQEVEENEVLLKKSSTDIETESLVKNTAIDKYAQSVNFLSVPITISSDAHQDDPLTNLIPPEVQERNMYGLLSNSSTNDEKSKIVQENKNNDDQPNSYQEDSDALSVISNEEYSLTSENSGTQIDSTNAPFHIADIIQDLEFDRLTHIDSPETSSTTEVINGESLMDDISSVLGHDIFGTLQDNTITDDTTICSDSVQTRKLSKHRRSSHTKLLKRDSSEDNPQQYGFENIVFEIDNRCDDQKIQKPIQYCSLAQFVEGNDIARKSFKRSISKSASTRPSITSLKKIEQSQQEPNNSNDALNNTIIPKIELSGSVINIHKAETVKSSPSNKSNFKGTDTIIVPRHDVKRISFDESCKKESFDDEVKRYPPVKVVVEPPSPLNMSDSQRLSNRLSEIRRHSSHLTSSTGLEYEKQKDRRYSGTNSNILSLDSEHVKYLGNSPAATRRISCGSLFKPNESFSLRGSKTSLLIGSSIFGLDSCDSKDAGDKFHKNEKDDTKNKKLPIINPLVCLPAWPNVSSGFISKCLLANADTLCAAVSPLMDPDETLLEGYHEKCVMNNYFGIGIDAKISLDFHNKREEHPEKCRSRAKNYMWYGVLGSKQWLQKTYKNLDQRVQLECDGQRIPLPSLQGIVILNIPSFMGGINFWGGSKEDDIFLAPSFDDRILEVVAVFGSVQMAASRLINLQHHRIAQCQSVQINILGDEEVPIQVDGEAWLQPPGMIRIIHKNRVQMLCRNRNLEVSLKSWQEKQRQHSISIQRDTTSTTLEDASATDELFSERENYILLNFIESVSSLIKWVKFLIISHPSLEHDLYALACQSADALEDIHPNGKLLEGPMLRIKLVTVIKAVKKLYEESCTLLRYRGTSLILREDLETKLSTALANMEMELKRCVIQKCDDGQFRAYFSTLVPNEEFERRKTKPFWMRFRTSSTAGMNIQTKSSTNNIRDPVNNWGVDEVATWLEAMQLSEYVDSFVKNDIRGKELLTLGRRDLKDLGVVKVGHMKRIQQAIKDLTENSI